MTELKNFNIRLYFNILFIIVLTFNSCDYFQQKRQDGVIAEIDGKVLYKSQIEEITIGLDSVDSVKVANSYIKQWATDILVYQEASKIHSDELEELVNSYRQTLFVNEYEQQLIARNMNINIPDSIIEDFYNSHSERFILKETVLKGILLVFPTGSPKQDKLIRWLKNPDEENLENIEKYMYQYGTGYELFLSEWRTANQVLMRLPADIDITRQQLHKQTLIESRDSLSVYLLQVTDKHFDGDIMPLEFARSEIFQILKNQRQTEFLIQERNRLYQTAVKHGNIKFYNEK